MGSFRRWDDVFWTRFEPAGGVFDDARQRGPRPDRAFDAPVRLADEAEEMMARRQEAERGKTRRSRDAMDDG